jgi:putative DNA primase/helicase
MADRREPPSQSEVERAFSDFMQRHGFLPGPIQVDTENFVRFDAPGDKAGKGNGFYKVRSGRFPVGWFGDWKSGGQIEWTFFDPNELSKEDKTAARKEAVRLKHEAQVARETKQAEVAENASRMWKDANSNVEGFPYLVKKGIEIARGVKIYTAKDGTRLLAVPMFAFDMDGKPQLQNLQLIDADGNKRFMAAGRVDGTFFSIKGDTDTIVICEGYATGVNIWEASGLSVVCAFNAGNLLPVARDFKRHRPSARLLIAGDDDAVQPDDWERKGNGRPWENVGAKKASAAAKDVGCLWILPHFINGQGRTRTDFDDLRREEGIEAVQRQILGAFHHVDPAENSDDVQIKQADVVQDETWRADIPRTTTGQLDGTNVHGVQLYIKNHKLLRGRLTFNEFTKAMELDGNELQDWHVAEFRRIMHQDRFKAKKSDVQDEMEAEARRNTHDPLTDYLAGVKWDGKPRLDTWLTVYGRVADSLYTQTVGRKALIGSVARALNPGVKFDTMLVLEGDQGIGKSTMLRYLFGDRYFIDHLPDFHSKDSFLQLQGAWCVEVAELSALGKADVKDVKQFLSRLVDKFRPPYGKNTIQVARRAVFIGTVNPEDGGYLRDPTGARRFWPVLCEGQLNLQGILRDRDQLWAEAVQAYKSGETFHLVDDDSVRAATEEQDKRREQHPWEDVLGNWLDRNPKGEVTIAELLNDALKIPAEKQIPKHKRDAGAAMRSLGWKATTQRRGPENKPTVLFLSPRYVASQKLPPFSQTLGPDDDVDLMDR